MADKTRWIPGGPHSHYMRYDLKFTKLKGEQKNHFSADLSLSQEQEEQQDSLFIRLLGKLNFLKFFKFP